VLLFKLSKQQVDRLGKLWRTLFQRLFKEIASPFDPFSTLRRNVLARQHEASNTMQKQTHVSFDKFAQISIVNLECDRESEKIEATLVHLFDDINDQSPRNDASIEHTLKLSSQYSFSSRKLAQFITT
jgi:hypothetical protein